MLSNLDNDVLVLSLGFLGERESESLQDVFEIGLALVGCINVSARAIHSGATSVDDAADLVDKVHIVDVTSVGESLQLFRVIEIVLVILRPILDVLGPEEETGNPLQIRMLRAPADGIRGLAEIYRREHRRAALLMSASACEIIQLTEIADTRQLDDAPAPPAATLHVGTRFLMELGCWIIGARFTITELEAPLKLACIDVMTSVLTVAILILQLPVDVPPKLIFGERRS